MKKTILVIFTGILSFHLLLSQTENDSSVYHQGLSLLDKAKNPEQFLESATYFEKISAENPEHWLATYYAGLSYILAAKDAGKNADRLLDKAQQFVDKSIVLKPDEPENHVLQAFLYQVRLSVDPQGRALNFYQKAEACLKKAMAGDSSNPRAYFLMANNVYNTPPVFKGGPRNALPVFIKAREKFRSYKPPFSFAPYWGEEQNEEMIRLCSNPKS
ncbi:MAG TPA: hypothetical protein VHI78_02765 [Bacteroidales bacterium]|jgi:tetratricopeptide (TPR) repeat protein|nr:hypothetical protein [Bacteroidales bacterium]